MVKIEIIVINEVKEEGKRKERNRRKVKEGEYFRNEGERERGK